MEEATPGFVARPAQKVRSALFDVYNDRLIELSFSPYEKRNQQGPFIPSLSLALRLLLLVRTAAAMYSIISDCDEGEYFFFLPRRKGYGERFNQKINKSSIQLFRALALLSI